MKIKVGLRQCDRAIEKNRPPQISGQLLPKGEFACERIPRAVSKYHLPLNVFLPCGAVFTRYVHNVWWKVIASSRTPILTARDTLIHHSFCTIASEKPRGVLRSYCPFLLSIGVAPNQVDFARRAGKSTQLKMRSVRILRNSSKILGNSQEPG